MKRPNFFIVGAPKCGTTALSQYLREHRDVFVSWPKEPHFFATDFDEHRRIKTLRDYERLFEPAEDRHLAVGEASIWYLYSRVAARNIRSYNKDARIIALLRNPVALFASLHNQLLYNFWEDEENAETAWRLQAVRAEGQNLPASCPEPTFLQYTQACSLGEQVERLLRVFPREQVKFFLLEDLAKSPGAVYEETLSFLRVPSDGRRSFPQINTRKRHRIRWLGRFFMDPPPRSRFIEAQVKKGLRAAGIMNYKAWHRLIQANERRAPKPEIPSRFRAELSEVFRDDVVRLSELIGRDLTGWLEPSTPVNRSAAHRGSR
jgi:hypothetical protein